MRSTFTLLLVSAACLLSGCAVVGLAATVAGVAVDAAVGTVKVVGSALSPSKPENK